MTRNSANGRRSPAAGGGAGRSRGGFRRSRSLREEEEERRRRRREEEEEEERRRRSHRHRRSRSSSRDRSRRHRSSSRGSRRRRSRSRSRSRGRRSESVEKGASKEREKSGGDPGTSRKTTAASDSASALQVATARAAALKTGLATGQTAAMTSQLLIQQSLAVANELAKAQTGIGLPSYYNPTAVNPLKYAEQMQKRKLLWQNKTTQPKEQAEEKPTSSCAKVWEKMTFSQDEDGKMTAKFRKLMGIKGEAPQTSSTGAEGSKEDPLIRKQEKLFRDLDQQYEMARISTHTQRGVGLGYSSQMASMYAQMPVPK